MNHNPYAALTDTDRRAMLASMKMESMEGLLAAIPEKLRYRAQFDLPEALPEWELDKHMRALAAENCTTLSMTSFLGAGFYEHHVPAAVDALSERGEFLTSYTPYQPEMSQGSLQVIAEYQYVVGQLLGVPLVNASCYDGATAFADAFAMALRADRSERRRLSLAETVWPQTGMIVGTHFAGRQVEFESAPHGQDGGLDLERLERAFRSSPPVAFGFQTPNKFGVLENIEAVAQLCRKYQVTSIVSYHPFLSGLFMPPGELGIDIVCGEGQVLGNYLYAGGASFGFLGSRMEFAPHITGRLVGMVESDSGKALYSLIRQEREQHVSRERATSNICTNQALCAMRAVFYLSLLGDGGLERLAELNLAKAGAFALRLCTIPGVSLAFSAPFFNEFLVRVPVPVDRLLRKLRERGIYGGLDGASLGVPDALLVAVTETKGDDQLASSFDHFKRCIEELRHV
jgi:glycine cleavage system pyridoxal-binding protein P